MTSGSPTTIGPYTITRELGRGGMGVVYLATDTRLDRQVAIKALPAELASDPARLERFEREARTLAQLNHPNLAGIHGVEEQDGAKYLVLEFVEGETLADMLDRGPIPVDEAIELAVQIAAGIEAAHEAGVIHRDLKPANIIVTPEGRAKVLDFGLARTDEGGQSSTGGLDSPTMTRPRPQHSPTIAGAILGTAAYMSPEQARGRKVDKRTDIWSFGVVLYEMLAGSSPFHGETATDSMGAVLHKNFTLDGIPETTPRLVRHMLQRCLERDKTRRFQSIGDVRIELEDALAGRVDPFAAPTSAGHGRRTARRLGYAAAVVASMLIGLVGGSLVFQAAPPTPRVVKLELPLVEFGRNESRSATISPDGRWVVFVGDEGLWLRGMDQTSARLLPSTENATNPFWAPDSRHIGFLAGKSVYKTSLNGAVSVVCETDSHARDIAGGAWSEDGWITFTMGHDSVYEVLASGGAPKALFQIDPLLEEDFHETSPLPNDRGTLLVVHRLDKGGDTIAVYADGVRKVLLQIPGDLLYTPVYDSSGYILFNRKQVTPGVWAVPFSLDRLEVTGEPFLVAANGSSPSVSLDGTLIYSSRSPLVGNRIVWLDRTGARRVPVGEPMDFIQEPKVSPNGRYIIFGSAENINRDIWLQDTQRETRTRLTFDPTDEVYAIWSPDNGRIAVSTGWTVGRAWFIQDINATHEKRDMGPGRPRWFSRDGSIIIGDLVGEMGQDICYWNESGEVTMFIQTQFDERNPTFSPDNMFVAYQSNESGRDEVYMTRFPSGQGKWQVSVDGGRDPVWSSDGSEILYIQGTVLMSVPVDMSSGVSIGKPEKLFIGDDARILFSRGYDLSADGQSILAIQSNSEQEETRDAVVVVQNWYAEYVNR